MSKRDNPYVALDKLYLSILEDDFLPENEDRLSNLHSIPRLLALACEEVVPIPNSLPVPRISSSAILDNEE